MTEVALVRWPEELHRRQQLVEARRPRLLIVAAGIPAPVPEDCIEDWVRVPAEEADVRARIESLAFRAGHHVTDDVPEIDDDGLLRVGAAWVSLPPVEARLMGVLVERFGGVVGRTVLEAAGWPGGSRRRNALDVHMLRLRRRIVPVGVTIRTVRNRGYLLERSERPGVSTALEGEPDRTSATGRSSAGRASTTARAISRRPGT